jgi:hypothetical protein
LLGNRSGAVGLAVGFAYVFGGILLDPTIYLGERLGLYRALREGGPPTSGELAMRTGTNERYLREWLEHHAASGLLDVDDVAADPLARRFSLPTAHAPVLLDRDDARFGAYRAIDVVRAARPLPDLVDAFRNGTSFLAGRSSGGWWLWPWLCGVSERRLRAP